MLPTLKTCDIVNSYAIDFMFLTAAKLMVLDRMSVFAASQGTRVQNWWAAAGRGVLALVVLGNAVGLSANIAAAVQYTKAASAASEASSAFYIANNTKTAQEFEALSKAELQRGGSISSVQQNSEVAVLLLIILAFLAVGVLCARRFTAMLQGVDRMRTIHEMNNRGEAPTIYREATIQGKQMRLQMVGIAAFIFVSFLLRSVFSTMQAVSFQLRDVTSETCTEFCGICNNNYTLMNRWISYTPQFQLIVNLIASPVALLVALWGMTTKSTLQTMKLSSRDNLTQSMQQDDITQSTRRQTLPADVL